MSTVELAATSMCSDAAAVPEPIEPTADFLAAVEPLLERRAAPGRAVLSTVVPVRPARVCVISGSYGAGHDAAAHQVARRLELDGHEAVVLDVVEMFPLRLGRFARWLYLRQLDLVPESWGTLLARLQPGTRDLRAACAFMHLAAPRIRQLAGQGADLFVSTHPFASQVLGELRASDQLAVPVVTYLVDASVHPLWVHGGVDLHLGLHEGAVRAARSLGGRSIRVQPLVPESYLPHRRISLNQRLALRLSLGLHAAQRMVLVVGGSLGIGDLEQTAVEIRDTGLAVPVVVCGTNDRLHDRLLSVSGVLPLRWRDDLPALIQTADCVVGNAGGFTAWECLAAGTPMVTARSLPGHGTANAAMLDEAGLVPWVRSTEELSDALRAAFDARTRPTSLPLDLVTTELDA